MLPIAITNCWAIYEVQIFTQSMALEAENVGSHMTQRSKLTRESL